MAISPQIIHGYGPVPAPGPGGGAAGGPGGLPLGEVTIPLLDYKVPTVVLLAFAVLVLFLLHLAGFRFVGVIGASASAGR